MKNIKIDDRTNTIDYFRLQEIEDLLNSFVIKHQKKGNYLSLEVVITGPKNPANKMIEYDMKLHATRQDKKNLEVVEGKSHDTRSGVQQLLRRLEAREEKNKKR